MNADEPAVPPPPAPMNADRALPPGMENASAAEIIEYMHVQAVIDMMHIQSAAIQAQREFQSAAIQVQRDAIKVQNTTAEGLRATSAYLMNLKAARAGQNRQSNSETTAFSFSD